MEINGEPAFTGILHDLSRRVAIEDALRKSEERVRSIVESAVDAIIVIDERGAIQAFNPSAERLFGYRLDEVLGRNVNMLMPSPDRERHDGYLHHYLTTGDQKIIGIGREVTALRRGRHDVSRAFVGRRDEVRRRETQLHRHPSRSERSRRSRATARRTEVSGQTG